VSERLRAIVDGLCLGPGARVLEIGCGHGVAATFVCERLESGRLTAIDRSLKMVAAAARRNAVHVDAGKAEFLVAELEDLELGDRRFDTIFAVRVGLFHREPERARALAERWLAPSGELHAFVDAPPARLSAAAGAQVSGTQERPRMWCVRRRPLRPREQVRARWRRGRLHLVRRWRAGMDHRYFRPHLYAGATPVVVWRSHARCFIGLSDPDTRISTVARWTGRVSGVGWVRLANHLRRAAGAAAARTRAFNLCCVRR